MRLPLARAVALLACSALILSGCSAHRFFYYPDRRLYVDPHKLKLDYEMKWFESTNGRKLFALYFPARSEPKGIVVHFHGNFGNVSNHFIGSSFLVDHGFDVLVFDYQGYGGSEGRPSPARTVGDGVAALRFAAKLNRNPSGGVVVLAQSLGGAVAIPAMTIEPVARAAVIQAAFTNYRSMARDVLGRSVITWILYPIYPSLLYTRYQPARYVTRLPAMPLLFIHGSRDEVVPIRMTRELYARAKEPKELWVVEGAGHNDLRQHAGDAYDDRVAAFFTAALAPTSKD